MPQTTKQVENAAKNPASILNGVYRVEWSEKELIAARTSPRYAHSNCPGRCVLTLTLRDGHLRVHGFPPPDCLGTYTVAGKTVSILYTVACHGLINATWSLLNGQLHLHVTRATDPGDEITFGAKPWKKIG